MDTAFLLELARRVKRHPQSYPAWVVVLADDIIANEATRQAHEYAAAHAAESKEADAARRFLTGN